MLKTVARVTLNKAADDKKSVPRLAKFFKIHSMHFYPLCPLLQALKNI